MNVDKDLLEALKTLTERCREIVECNSDIGAGQISVYDSDFTKMVNEATELISKHEPEFKDYLNNRKYWK